MNTLETLPLNETPRADNPRRQLNKHNYVTGLHDRQDWDAIGERVAELNIPADAASRAYDIAHHFTQNGIDIKMLSFAVHQALVPDYRTVEIDSAHSVSSPNGELSKELALPEERQAIFDKAAELIGELVDEMEATGRYDNFLERAGDTIAMAVVLTHQFADGNGRTARFLAELVRSGPDSEDLRIAGTNRPTSGFRINSYLPKGGTTPVEALEATAGRGIALSDERTYQEQLRAVVSTSYI